MGLYQGRALARRGRPRRLRVGRLALLALALLVAGTAVARLPWARWRARHAVLTRIEVRGQRYLDPERVAAVSGLARGADLLALDLRRARERLERHPRLARATVRRAWLRGVCIEVDERLPVLVVDHGVPWEMDGTGTLMPPLLPGALADAPLLTGPDLSRFRAGEACGTPAVRRALAWLRRLDDPRLRLLGELSEVDVRESGSTGLVLAGGARVIAPAWPLPVPRLSALRVVLADLAHRGVRAQEMDLRFGDQVIVRPVDAAVAATGGGHPSPGR